MEQSVTKVNMVVSVYICDKCSIGEMKPTGRTLLTDPAIYEHKCENCGSTKEFRKCYPLTTIK